MKLSEAIRKAIKENGIDNVKANFMGFMMDYHAFEDDKLAKVVISQLAKKGYMPTIFDTVSQKDEIQFNALKNSIINEFAFDKQVVTRVFDEFDIAIGKKKRKLIVIKDKTQKQQIDNQQSNYKPQSDYHQQSNYNQQRNYTPQTNYEQPQNNNSHQNYQQPYYCDNKTGLNQNVESYRILSNRDVGYPYNRPFTRQTKSQTQSDEELLKKRNHNETRAWKIFAIIVAIGLNIPAYYISGWWLIPTIILTLLTICMFFMEDEYDDDNRIWIGYALLIAVFITIFTPIPWWILVLEIIGYVIAFMVICMA